MRICIVAEGCYPYVLGGVSNWIHSLINSFPNEEFIILAIVANRSISGKFAYTLPENVTEVHEMYMDDCDWGGRRDRLHRKRLKEKEFLALRSLIMDQDVDWDTLFDFFHQSDLSIDHILMGEDFLRAVVDCYNQKYPQIVFSDFLWTMRSIYTPLFYALRMNIPKADLYHCVATGYAGVLGSMAKHFYGSRLMISEHGIYTREREEELIRATWVQGIYKNMWIEQFRKLSYLGYQRADLVTSLYAHARGLQIELGCLPAKTLVTPNGIDTQRLANLPGRQAEDAGRVNIGAVLRVTPIKDVKTMLQAFAFARKRDERLRLWVMGPWEEDAAYAQECFDLVETQHIPDVVFTGRVDVKEYLGRMDATILTSISEGQPLTILESFAAHCPVIATDVGNCKGLLYGEDDDFGEAGILTHIMNIEEIADAMLEMAKNPEMRNRMGEAGYRRVMKKYKRQDMVKIYEKLYHDFSDSMGLRWTSEPFRVRNE